MSQAAKISSNKTKSKGLQSEPKAASAKKLLNEFTHLAGRMTKTHPKHPDAVSTVREIRSGR